MEVISNQHPETGETMTDEETGELRQRVYCVRSERRCTDGETGEEQTPPKKFHVPRQLQNATESRIHVSQRCSSKEESHKQMSEELFHERSALQSPNQFHQQLVRLSTKEEFHGRPQRTSCIEKRMVNISPVVFMLPTLLFFPAWASILCVICETCIHIWSHKRNKMTGHTAYRSPLHLISSEFCAPCRTDKWMQQISKMQDRRTQRRNMIHPEYMRHVVR